MWTFKMIRYGIVGASGIAKKFARDILYTTNSKLVAVSARTKEKAKEYKEFYNVEYAYSSYESLAKSDKIDAVYIATPHNFHYEQAILFMKNKKHVLIEKPISVNTKELLEMIQVAKDNNVLMMEAMWTHFLPSAKFIKKIINNEETGKLIEAHIDFGYSLIEDYPKERRLLNMNLAGGSLLDMGIYPVGYYLYLQKAPIKTIEAKASFSSTGIDLGCDILITDTLNGKIYLKSRINEYLPNNAKLIYEFKTIEIIDFSRSSEIYIDGFKIDIDYLGEGFSYEIESFSDGIINNLKENSIRPFSSMIKSMQTLDKIRDIIKLKYPFE